MMKRSDRMVTGWIVLLALLWLWGCGPTEEEKASARLRMARVILQGGDTTAALLHLDSVLMWHPKAAVSGNAATNLRREIHWDIYQRKQLALDSARARIARLERSFVLTQGEFERTPRYVHQRQIPEENLSRSYLRADVTPAGEVVLTSQYYGSGRLAHQRIRVWEGEQEAFTDTVPLESADVYHGSFLGTTWERVTFRSGREDGMAPFIVAHAGKRLKMAFLGKGSQYVIFLEERDIKAIGEAVELAAALREEKKLTMEISRLHIR
ncbi:MAG: hypothetical protein KA780_04215 [Prolixibacteraceae bacterium]|jgi:hypothetical protein|nr:hypothetical protein [Prolixibacteraceae bacterium]